MNPFRARPQGVFVLILLTTMAAGCLHASPLSSAQAIQTAADFCKAIGSPVTAPGTAVRAASVQDLGSPPRYWQPGWRVQFGPDLRMGVADSGVIYDYFLSSGSDFDRQPAGKAISRAAALAKADAVLTAAHVTETLALPRAWEENISSPPQRGSHLWTVIRRRQAQGVTFLSQQATVLLDAETGIVRGLGVTFPTPLPRPVKPVITQAQAVAAAQSALFRLPEGGTGFRPSGPVRLIWITPETHSVTPIVNGVLNHPPAPSQAVALPSRLAWMCGFRDPEGNSADLAVDVITGQGIPDGIGFSYAPIRPRPAPTITPIAAPAFPPEPVIDQGIVAATVPGTAAQTPVPGVPQYRLSITDIYAPISTLTKLGFDCSGGGMNGNSTTDQSLAEKLEQAAQEGLLRLVAGPTAIVPEGGIWGRTRIRKALCQDPLYWTPRQVPAQIGMRFSIIPTKQPAGRIGYQYQQGTRAMTAGEAWSGAPDDNARYSWSCGDAGATTLLCGLAEESYTGTTETPGRFRTVGVMHIILVKDTPL